MISFRTRPLLTLALAMTAAFALTACKATDEAATAADSGHKAIITEQLEPYECGTITRLHTFGGVFLASQPAPSDFEQAKKGGVLTVINLRHAEENNEFNEQEVIHNLGLAYYNPAWDGPEELTDAKFDEVRALLKTADRPILLHCSSGNRVGAMWMAYRAIDGELDVEAAIAEAKIVGLKSPAYEQIARDYIAKHKTG